MIPILFPATRSYRRLRGLSFHIIGFSYEGKAFGEGFKSFSVPLNSSSFGIAQNFLSELLSRTSFPLGVKCQCGKPQVFYLPEKTPEYSHQTTLPSRMKIFWISNKKTGKLNLLSKRRINYKLSKRHFLHHKMKMSEFQDNYRTKFIK